MYYFEFLYSLFSRPTFFFFHETRLHSFVLNERVRSAPLPPPTTATLRVGLNSAWEEALEHDAASEAGAGERRLPTLAGTCKMKECMSFEGGVDVGEGLHVAGAAEVGGGDDVTQLRVLGAPLQTAPAVEISRGARAVLTVTAEGGLRAAGRVVSGDARDATTPADGAGSFLFLLDPFFFVPSCF